jgi:hypothetical protein
MDSWMRDIARRFGITSGIALCSVAHRDPFTRGLSLAATQPAGWVAMVCSSDLDVVS